MSIRVVHQTEDEIVIDFHGLIVALDRDTGMGDKALRISFERQAGLAPYYVEMPGRGLMD